MGTTAQAPGRGQTLGMESQHPTRTHTHNAHTAHTYTHTRSHTKHGALRLTRQTQPGQGPAYSKGNQHYRAQSSSGGPSRWLRLSPPVQAGGLGPGPATRYKIKNISNIQ